MSDGVAPSKGAWTPGPWQREGDLVYTLYAPENRDRREYRNGEVVLVNRFTASVSNCCSEAPKEEILANALLISKSPQMAAFISKFVQHGRMWRVPDENQWNCLTGEAERLLSELEVKP